MIMKEEKTISDFFNKEYKDYAMSVIEDRSIASVCDGLKPSQRKVIFAADKIWKNNDKPKKVFQLSGITASESMYTHGDASLNACITTMGQKFKNNLPLLDDCDTQYGSRFSPYAGAPRYISTKLSPNFRLLYKDFEILEGKIEEGVVVEPPFYLPVIPVLLLNSSEGISVGFAQNILNRNPKDVVDCCIKYLNGKKFTEPIPYYNDFRGEYRRDTDNPLKWYCVGKYEIVNTTTVHITEIPYSMTFEKYENILNTLIDKKIIVSYEDHSAQTADYIVKFQRSVLNELKEKGTIESTLKLVESETENLTALDENGKLKIFESVSEIIKYFVDFRLVYYQKRKDYLIDKYKKELTDLCWRAKFIKAIIDKKLVVNNKPKEEIVKWLEENKFEKMNNDYNYLLNMNILSLTKEKYEDLMNKAHQKKEDLNLIEKKEPKEMYLEDLQELKKKI